MITLDTLRAEVARAKCLVYGNACAGGCAMAAIGRECAHADAADAAIAVVLRAVRRALLDAAYEAESVEADEALLIFANGVIGEAAEALAAGGGR